MNQDSELEAFGLLNIPKPTPRPNPVIEEPVIEESPNPVVEPVVDHNPVETPEIEDTEPTSTEPTAEPIDFAAEDLGRDDHVPMTYRQFLTADKFNLNNVTIIDKGINVKHPSKLASSYLPFPFALGTTSAVTSSVFDYISKHDLESDVVSEEKREQLRIVGASMGNTLLPDNDLYKVGRQDGITWQQGVPLDDNKVMSNVTPKFTLPNKGSEINDQRFSEMIARKSGLGSKIRVPLWNTGIWVTLTAPNANHFIDLDKAIADDKVSVGRQTRGGLYSTETSFLESRVADFALSMVQSTNYAGGVEQLKDIIKLPDLHLLAWSLMCVRFPDGHPYEQACSVDMDNCSYVARDVLDLNKCIWTDVSKFSESQRKHMSRIQGNITDDDLTRYQDEFAKPASRRIILSNNLFIDLKIPTINDMIEQAVGWINGLEASINQTFGQSISPNQKLVLLEQKDAANAICHYIHWYERVGELDDEGEILYSSTNRDSIIDSLVTLAGEELIYNEIIEGVRAYISDTTTFVIGIPNYACPSCGKWHNTEAPSQYIVKLDVFNLFFILYRNIIQRALSAYTSRNTPGM